ncbi:MAG: hypothetical protein IPK80_23295 [Nannocystis sp.]|nr:hypothetical protein [Nannocystis sp.]
MSAPIYQPAPDRLALDRAQLAQLGLDLGPVLLLPVAGASLEAATIVRRLIDAHRPAAIAVDLPRSAEPQLLRAVARLPLLSVITLPRPRARPHHIIIEPTDPQIEAIRRAQELQLPLHCVGADPDDTAPPSPGPLPDPTAADAAGALHYLRALLAATGPSAQGPDPAADHLALELALLAYPAPHAPSPRLLALCPPRAIARLCAALRGHLSAPSPPPTPLRPRPRPGITLEHLSEAASRSVLAELPFFAAAYERSRAPATSNPTPNPPNLLHLFSPPIPDPPDLTSSPDAHAPIPPQPLAPVPPLTGRIALLSALCRAAQHTYRRAVDQPLRPGVIAQLLRYACRYALTEGRLAPDLYQLLIAARGFVDDTYASELWEHATTYPWQSAAPGLPVLDLALADLGARVRHLRFRPRRLERRLRALAPPPRQSRPGEWAERFGDGICSYPPEDLVIEGTSERLRGRADRQLLDERQSSVPFTAALERGLDLRETLRRWHEGVLYVHVERPVRGRAGDVVLIFEDELLDVEDPKYPWHITWQGESAAEGDIATYATDPFEQIIGPGIGRARYGGLLLHRPAGTMHDIWRGPDEPHLARTKAEHLLLAALRHSSERAIIYIAPTPPRRQLRHHAQRMDKRILYTPLGQLTPQLRRRLRVFHVLSDPAVREIAPRYIR